MAEPISGGLLSAVCGLLATPEVFMFLAGVSCTLLLCCGALCGALCLSGAGVAVLAAGGFCGAIPGICGNIAIVCPIFSIICLFTCGTSLIPTTAIVCCCLSPIYGSIAGCASLACCTTPIWGSAICAGLPCILFVLGCTPVGIILTMFTEPFWYPILRICHAAVCPPETYLSIFESCSQLFCFGIPPSCGMNALDQGLILCTNLSPIHLINTMGNTSCSTGTGMVLNCCGFRWVEQIFTSTCGAFSSACASCSPTLFISGVYSSYMSCCSSLCIGLSPFTLLQRYLGYSLGGIQNIVLGCCGFGWTNFLCENMLGVLQNPIPWAFGQATGLTSGMLACIPGVGPGASATFNAMLGLCPVM